MPSRVAAQDTVPPKKQCDGLYCSELCAALCCHSTKLLQDLFAPELIYYSSEIIRTQTVRKPSIVREERPKIECDSARVVRVLVKRGQFRRRRRRAGSTFYCRRFITAMAGGSQVTATRLWCSIGLKRARIHGHTKFLNLL